MEIRSKHNCKIQIHSCIPFISRINKHHIFNHLNLATSENSKVNAVLEATSLIAFILGLQSKEISQVKIIILYFEKKIVFRISLYLRMMLFVIWVAIQCEWIVSELNCFQMNCFQFAPFLFMATRKSKIIYIYFILNIFLHFIYINLHLFRKLFNKILRVVSHVWITKQLISQSPT